MGLNWEIPEKPVFKEIEGNTITFADDSKEEVDAIILCTGYKHYFPFLSKDLNLECQNRIWVNNLKNGVIS